jgi:hypothetical protein
MNTDIASGSDIPGAAGGNLALLLTHNIQKQTVLNVHKLTGSLQQDGLFQKVNWYSILAYALAFAFGFEPAKTVFPVLRQVSAQGTFGYACLLAYTGFDLSGLGTIQILCQQRG